MKVNFDGLRKNLTGSMRRLADQIESVKDDISSSDYDELCEAFDEAAQDSNILNCLYSDSDESFNDLSDSMKCRYLVVDDD